MDFPKDLKYTKEHEWIRIDGTIATEGITDYAQNELSDIVYVALPPVGREVQKGSAMGTIEAVKAVVDLYAGVSGEVVEVNDRLKEEPGVVNSSPYEEGWMVRIKVSSPEELNNLMDAETYQKMVEEEK
jgi:glycine cleavage system H protein